MTTLILFDIIALSLVKQEENPMPLLFAAAGAATTGGNISSFVFTCLGVLCTAISSYIAVIMCYRRNRSEAERSREERDLAHNVARTAVSYQAAAINAEAEDVIISIQEKKDQLEHLLRNFNQSISHTDQTTQQFQLLEQQFKSILDEIIQTTISTLAQLPILNKQLTTLSVELEKTQSTLANKGHKLNEAIQHLTETSTLFSQDAHPKKRSRLSLSKSPSPTKKISALEQRCLAAEEKNQRDKTRIIELIELIRKYVDIIKNMNQSAPAKKPSTQTMISPEARRWQSPQF